MTGRVLAINTGSTSTKIAYFVDGAKLFEQNLAHSVEALSKFDSVMDQDLMRKDAITEFLYERRIPLSDIDIVMARGGLITPIKTGIYEVTPVMRAALVEAKEGVHACNLSALIADDLSARRIFRILPWLTRSFRRQKCTDSLNSAAGLCSMR